MKNPKGAGTQEGRPLTSWGTTAKGAEGGVERKKGTRKIGGGGKSLRRNMGCASKGEEGGKIQTKQ